MAKKNARLSVNAKNSLQQIIVKNADGDSDTVANVLVRNKIQYTPKISVIIPVYNVEKYLRECLDSVVNQTLKKIEIICVDDGSTDSSLDILKEYARCDKRITVITQKNLHAGVARNAGLAVARGEYLSFLDSDDFFELNMLEEMYNKAIQDLSDIVVCEYNIYDDDKKIIVNKFNLEQRFVQISPVFVKDLQDDLFNLSHPNSWSKLFRRQLFFDNGLRFEKVLRCNDFTCVYTAMAVANKISLIDKTFITYRSNQKNNVTANRANQIECFLFAVDKLEKNLERLNLYNMFEKTFVSRIKASYKWELSVCTKNQQDLISQNAKQILSDRVYQILYAPKVSVIIPCYNVEKYLRECLDSVVNQTLKEIEILCVNDGSIDNTLSILREYEVKDARIMVIDQCNQGMSCSRNNALKIAKGEYILFLDSDDWLRQDSCKLLYEHSENFGLDMLNFEGIKYYDDTKKLERVPGLQTNYASTEDTIYTRRNIESIVDKIPISACLMFYKHTFIKNNNLKFPEGLFFEDNLFVHMALNCIDKYGVKKEELYYRRSHSAQTTQNWDKLFAHYIKIVKYVYDFYLDKSKFKQEVKDKIINNYLVGAIYRWSTFSALLKQKYLPELYNMVSSVAKRIEVQKFVSDFLQRNYPSKFYSEILSDWYFRVKKEKLNIENPVTYNEKLQWLKLYNSTPIKTLLADKYLVRDWVAKKIGEEYLVPIYGSFDCFDEIVFDKLPNQFVIKTNHGCGWNIIVKNKAELDLVDAKAKIDRWMNDNYAYKWGTELHYRDIKPKIIIEKYIAPEESNHEIQVWCFSKKIKFVSVETIKDAAELERGTFYPNEKPTKFLISPNHYKKLNKITDSKAFHKALELAKKMLIDVPYVRIDFIEYRGSVLFRELTFTSGSGLSLIVPNRYNMLLGKWIKLPKLAYDVDTGTYYKLPKKKKIKKDKKHIRLKPYLLFPYYLVAMLFMKRVLLPLKKWRLARRHLFEMANDYKDLKGQIAELRGIVAETKKSIKQFVEKNN